MHHRPPAAYNATAAQKSPLYLIAEAGGGPLVFIIIGILLPPVAWFVGKWV